MLILVLDSCGSACAAGVWQDGRVLAEAREFMQRGQDARLMPMIVEVMASSGHDFGELDKIAVTRGPGSFTGARVCLAAARGIGLASGKPVMGVDRFSIYRSLSAPSHKNLLVVIDSKRSELFCKFFPAAGEAHDACLMTAEQIETFKATHSETDITGDIASPDAGIIAACAELASTVDAHNPDFLPFPLYLRAPDVTFAGSSLKQGG